MESLDMPVDPGLLMLGALLGPLVGAILVLTVGDRLLGVIRITTIVAGLSCAVVLVAIVGSGTMGLVAVGGWTPPLGIVLRADGPAVAFMALSAVVVAAVFVSCRDDPSFNGEGRMARLFWALVFILWTGLVAAFLTRDLFNMYVALELTSLSGIALVALSGQGHALQAQMRYMIQATFGSLLFLMGVALIYGQAGALDMGLVAVSIEPSVQIVTAAVLISLGLMMKSAIWPLHAWLPPAHGAAPAPVSALLSALVVKASLYLLFRLWSDLFGSLTTETVLTGFGIFGAGAVLWGSVMALGQARLKPMIAYSTVAQLGYGMLLFPLGGGLPALAAGVGWSAALLHLMSHGVAKAAMFLAAGALIARLGTDERHALAGAGRKAPVAVFALALAGLAIMGLPPSGGFVAKWLMLRTALGNGQWWLAAVLILGGLLAAAYLLRFLLMIFVPPKEDDAGQRVPVDKTDGRTGSQAMAAMGLALLSVALGLATAPVLTLIAGGQP